MSAQYTYINDVGTSSLQVSHPNDFVLSGSLISPSINYLNLGYSPIKHIGLFLGPHFHRQQKDKNTIQVKGKGINAAIGTYYFVHAEQNNFFHSRNLQKVGVLFYAKLGTSRSNITNTIRSSRNKILESIFEYQKHYWDFGFQLVTTRAKIDFNYKQSHIYYLGATLNGDYRNNQTYVQVIEGNFRNNNFFRDAELNVQVDYGKGYLNLTSGLVVFLPLKSASPQIVYQRIRSLYLGFNLNLHQLSEHLKKYK